MGMDAQWRDCFKLLPYRDYNGRWQFFSVHTQRRFVAGRWQYREREETQEEYDARQW